MVNMTLDAMIQETAVYVGESDNIGASPYTGDALKIANKIISGINIAYNNISKYRWRLFHKETITLGSGLTIDITALAKTFSEVKSIKCNDVDVSYEFINSTTIELPNNSQGDSIDITYYYTPAELSGSSLTGKVEHTNGTYDNKILCFYAAYHYLQIDADETAPYWLNLYNEGYDGITQNTGQVKRVSVRSEY